MKRAGAQAAIAPTAVAQTAGAQTTELPRAGAARPLRLITAAGAPLQGIARDVAWETRGGGLFFTLEAGGTRNIWRAFPDPQDASRYPAWRALPVTNLRAPRFAAQAVPLPGDRALVCVSNALARAADAPAVAQIIRYDLPTAFWTPLSDALRAYEAPALSPDGTRVAFNDEGAPKNVYVGATENAARRVLPDLVTVAREARHALWLDDQTLLLENLAPAARGLYRLTLRENAVPQLVLAGGGEAGALGASGLVFAAKTAVSAPPNLYLIARDGSGLRMLPGTTGARHPAVSPDGKLLAFDAPPDGANERADTARALWVVPLQEAPALPSASLVPDQTPVIAAVSVGETATGADAPREPNILNVPNVPNIETPIAQLSVARALPGDVIGIIGVLRGPAYSAVALEFGQGEKPRRWETLRAQFPAQSPLLDEQGNRLLGVWNPPTGARGVWTLRLSISGLGGAAQSLLRVRLPLVAPDPKPNGIPVMPPPVKRPNIGAPAPPNAFQQSPFPDVMLPPLPPAPSDASDVPSFPIAPAPPPTPLTNVAPVRATPPKIVPTPVPKPVATPAPPPTLAEPPTVPDANADADANTNPNPNAPFVARFNVSGTPAKMAPGQKVSVTFWGWNRGSATWQTGGAGADRVRVVARWMDFSTGTRRQWNFSWLQAPVAPDGRAKMELNLTAPTRPGKYKLIYGLVRLPDKGEFSAPPYNAPQEAWDGEFSAIAFAVEVVN